jgi:hypothetical protein
MFVVLTQTCIGNLVSVIVKFRSDRSTLGTEMTATEHFKAAMVKEAARRKENFF